MTHPKSQRGIFKFSALTIALALGFGQLHAQETSGGIEGYAGKGDKIEVKNSSISLSRVITVGDDGRWSVVQLPAGTYQVTVSKANGDKQTATVEVASGRTITAKPEETITISGGRGIDRSSVNTNFTLTKFEIDRIPLPASVTSATLLAPGTVLGDARFDSKPLPSIGGASVAENAYYINGFNVTNIFKGMAFNEVPFEAIGDITVNNGAYSVEYGRSLGGVVSVNTKRGTNEWKSGIKVSVVPGGISGSSIYAEKNTEGNWQVYNRPGGSTSTVTSAYTGGPIVKDKLYFFGLIQDENSTSDVYAKTAQVSTTNKQPKGLFKFDINVTDDNLLEVTYFNDLNKSKTNSYSQPTEYGGVRGTYMSSSTGLSGGENSIFKWTSAINQDLSVSALYGVGKYTRETVVGAAACPYVSDRRATTKALGCWDQSVGSQVTAPGIGDKRESYRVDAEWKLGKHQIRAGLDNEKFNSIDGAQYTGGNAYLISNLKVGSKLANGYVNNTGSVMQVVDKRYYNLGGSFDTINSAFYLEDNFRATKDILLNFGVRSESFENKTATGETFIKVNNTLAPRAGATWDLSGNGRTKVFANAGRYYIPVYSNTNARLSGAETYYRDFYQFDGTFSTDGKSVPGTGAALGDRITYSTGETPDPKSIVDNNIKPMFQDQFSLGFQQALDNKWVVGAKATNRKLKNGMDDVCDGSTVKSWATSNGYTTSQADVIKGAIDHCFLTNPGKALSANIDLNEDGNLTRVDIPASAMMLPEVKRVYQALEFTAEKPWENGWFARVSYVWSRLKGNAEGYVKSDNAQDDAGITQDFDHAGNMLGALGYLPNDRRHAFKFQGAFALTDEYRLGGTLTVQSGRPRNCFGYYAGPIADASLSSGAASFYCGGVLNPRGTLGKTAWQNDLSLQASYMPKQYKGLSLTFDVFNVLNNRTPGYINEVGEVAANTVSPDYLKPMNFQRARYFKISTEYKF